MLCRTWFGETTTLIPFPNRSPKLHDTDFKLHQNPNSISQKKRESPPVTSTTTANQTTKREKKINKTHKSPLMEFYIQFKTFQTRGWFRARISEIQKQIRNENQIQERKWEIREDLRIHTSFFFNFFSWLRWNLMKKMSGSSIFRSGFPRKGGKRWCVVAERERNRDLVFFLLDFPGKLERGGKEPRVVEIGGTDVQRVLVWKCQKLKKRKRHPEGYTKLCSALCQPSV